MAPAATASDIGTDAELEFLHELEDAIQALGSNRFTVDGRPAIVAAQTRARLGEAIKELTQAHINAIADGAEKFGRTSLDKASQRVMLEVVQGDDAMPDAQVQFPEAKVSAQYIFYNEEQKEDARLLQELKRIQYLQHVVMKQLEMTDRSGSTQVVQGMIASGQKFVAGLTAVFKQVETLSRQIEKGLQNKADMPTAEQKTVAIAAITQALRALPAIDPRHIAVKNMVMQQVERLQAKLNMTPAAPRQTAAIMQMKAPSVEAKADVRVNVKVDVKATVKATAKAAPVVKAHVEAKVEAKVDVRAEAKAAPMAVQAKAEIRTAPAAPTETMRQMSATITAIAPNVSVQQTAARVGNTSPVAVLQQTLAKSLGITPAAATPVSVTPAGVAPTATTLVSVAPVSAAPVQAARSTISSAPIASTSISTVSSAAPISVVQSVQAASVQTVAVQSAVVQSAVVQAPVQQVQTQPVQVQAVQAQAIQQRAVQQTVEQPVQQVQVNAAQQPQQQVQQPQQEVAKQAPLKAVEQIVQPINQAQQRITTTQPIVQPAQQMQIVTGQGINAVQHTAPIANVQPSAATPVSSATAQNSAANNAVNNTAPVSQQPAVQGQTGQATTDVTATSRNRNTNGNPNGTVEQARTDNQNVARSEPAGNKETPAEAKKSDAAVEKNPERPNTGERGQEAKGEKEADKKKDVVADSGCNTCTTKNCGACRVSSLQGNGSATVQYGNTNAKGETEAKAKITENAAKCAGCGGCGPGGCSRVAADPNAVAAGHNAALDKLGTRRRAAPALTPAAAA